MTLLAAFKYHDIPVIIGDLLVSTNSELKYLRRKLFSNGKDFVIGWTGDELVAKSVLSDIKTMANNSVITKELLERYLSNIDPHDFGCLYAHFTGWIVVDGQPSIFFWNSQYAEKVFFDDEIGNESFNGTGGDALKTILAAKISGKESKGTRESVKPVFDLIQYTSHLRAAESLFALNNFGVAYDICIYYQGAFKLVSSTLFIFWDFHLDIDGGLLERAPKLIKYICNEERATFQQGHIKNRRIESLSYEIPPAYMPGLAQEVQYPLDLESHFYVNYFLLRKEKRIVDWSTCIIMGRTFLPRGPLYINADPPDINFDVGELKNIITKKDAEVHRTLNGYKEE